MKSKNEFAMMYLVMQDKFRLETPGGGGYGEKDKDEEIGTPPTKKARVFVPTGSVAEYTATQESA